MDARNSRNKVIIFYNLYLLLGVLPLSVLPPGIYAQSEIECRNPPQHPTGPGLKRFAPLMKRIGIVSNGPARPDPLQKLRLKLSDMPHDYEGHIRKRGIRKLKEEVGIIDDKTRIYQLVNSIAREVLVNAELDSEAFEILLIDAEDINASIDVSEKRVYVNYGLLKFLDRNKMLTHGALKFIIGHEIGHLISDEQSKNQSGSSNDDGHGAQASTRSRKNPLAEEYFADLYGLQLLDRTGQGPRKSQPENPIEGLLVLETFEELASEGNGDGHVITTTHPHSHRRKMNAFHQISDRYWNNLFQQRSSPIAYDFREDERSSRFHFEKRLYSSLNMNEIGKVAPLISDYRELEKYLFMSMVTDNLQAKLNSCRENTEKIVSQVNLRLTLFRKMLPMHEISGEFKVGEDQRLREDFRYDGAEVDKVRRIFVEEKVIDEDGRILRKIRDKKERDRIYYKLLPIFKNHGHTLSKVIDEHINENNWKGESLGEKFLRDNGMAKANLGEHCDTKGIQEAIDREISRYEKRFKVRFGPEVREEFLLSSVANYLESEMDKFHHDLSGPSRKILGEKFRELIAKDGIDLTAEEAETFLGGLIKLGHEEPLKNPLHFEMIYPFFRETVDSDPLSTQFFKYLGDDSQGRLKWGAKLGNNQRILGIKKSDLMHASLPALTQLGHQKNVITDYLVRNGGRMDAFVMKLLETVLANSNEASTYLEVLERTLSMVKSKSPMFNGSFYESLVRHKFQVPLTQESFRQYLMINLKNRFTRPEFLKHLSKVFDLALKNGRLNPSEAIGVLDELIALNGLSGADYNLVNTLEKILLAEKDEQRKFAMIKGCRNCSTLNSEEIFKSLCERRDYYSDYNEVPERKKARLLRCMEAGIWMPLKRIIGHQDSEEMRRFIHERMQFYKEEYARRLPPEILKEYYTEVEWKFHFNPDVPIHLQQSFLERMEPSRYNRLHFFKEAREFKGLYYGNYMNPVPLAFKDLLGLNRESSQNSEEQGPKRCGPLLQFVQGLFGDKDGKFETSESSIFNGEDSIGLLLSLSDNFRVTPLPSFWHNFNERKLELHEKTLRVCLQEEHIDLKDDKIPLEGKMALIEKVFQRPSHARNTLILEALNFDPFTGAPQVFEQVIGANEHRPVPARVFDLLQDGPLKEMIGRRIIKEKMKEGLGPFATGFKDYKEVEEFFNAYSEEGSPMRRELMSEILQGVELSVSELEEYQAKERKDFLQQLRENKDRSALHELLERTSDGIENLRPQEKVHIFQWIIGKGSKPEVISAFERSSSLNLADWPRYLSMGSHEKRMSFLSTLLLGPNGILAHPEVTKDFIHGLYQAVMGPEASSTDTLLTLFNSVFSNSPQTRQMTLVYGLFSELLGQSFEERDMKVTPEERRNQLIRTFLTSFGTVGVKIGQVLSKQEQVIVDPKLRSLLEGLSDKVGPIDKLFVLSALRRDGIDIQEIDKIGRLLGSASLKQVYHLRLTDGSEHTLKFNRPMAYYQIPENLQILDKVLRSDEVKAILPVSSELFTAVRDAVQDELNILKEIEYQNGIADFVHKKGTKDLGGWTLNIPKVHKGLRGRHVFSDQLIKGAAFKDAVVEELTEDDLKNVSKLIFTSILEQMFRNGLYHADLHPGNILIDNSRKTVGLIDFGQSARLSKENGGLFARLVFFLNGKDFAKFTNHVESMLSEGSSKEIFRDQRIQDELKRIFETRTGEEAKISGKIRAMKTLLDRHSLNFNKELEILLKVLDSIQYITKNLTAKEVEDIFINSFGKLKSLRLHIFGLRMNLEQKFLIS